jgi:sulfopyruvate decarboxylase TPP-binding subunit
MTPPQASQASAGGAPKGRSIIGAIKAAGVEFVVALPDIVTCRSVLWPLSDDPEIRLVTVCKEDEGVSICAGLSYCERRAVLLIQHTGLLDSLNAVRVIAAEYQLPIFMIVGLQGMEPDRPPSRSASYGIRILEPILQAMAIDHAVLAREADVATIAPAIAASYAAPKPFVLLVSRSSE